MRFRVRKVQAWTSFTEAGSGKRIWHPDMNPGRRERLLD